LIQLTVLGFLEDLLCTAILGVLMLRPSIGFFSFSLDEKETKNQEVCKEISALQNRGHI
jgi:hypothetical protein